MRDACHDWIRPLAPTPVLKKWAGGFFSTVNGEKLDVDAGGAFDEFLTFEGGATAILVRATNARGGVAELRRRAVVVN